MFLTIIAWRGEKKRKEVSLIQTDIHKLKTTLFDRGYNQSKIAKALKIERGTLRNRMANGGQMFRLKDIYQMAKLLNLTKDEILEIFFADDDSAGLADEII